MQAYRHKPHYLHKLCLIKRIMKASELKYSAHCQNLLNNIVLTLGYYEPGEVVSIE